MIPFAFCRLLRLRSLLVVIALVLPMAHLCADDVKVDLSSNWKMNKGEEYPGAQGSFTCDPDTKNLRLNYDFTKGGQYVNVYSILPTVTGDLTGMKIEAKGLGGNFTVALVDATGQVLIYRFGTVGDSTQDFDVPLTGPSDGYGGANDKKPHYPLKEIRLTVEKGDQLKGELTFRSITLKTAAPAAPSTP